MPRWNPDHHLIDAAKAGRLYAARMTGPDRCHVVAVLTAHGYPSADIGRLLHCSRRTIKYIRAQPLTQYICDWHTRFGPNSGFAP